MDTNLTKNMTLFDVKLKNKQTHLLQRVTSKCEDQLNLVHFILSFLRFKVFG